MSLQKVLFLIVFFIAYTVQAITGFAGNILAMSPGIHLIGMDTTIVLLNVAGVLGCGMLAIRCWKSIDWAHFSRVIVVLFVFLFVGIWLDTVLPLRILLTIYGVIIIAVAVRNLALRKQVEVPAWLLWVVVACAGIIQGMFVSGGAFLVIWATHTLKGRDTFRGTMSLIWTLLNLVYLVIKTLQGVWTAETVQLAIFLLPLIFISTFLGDRLQRHIGKEGFIRFVYVLLLCIGIFTTASSVM